MKPPVHWKLHFVEHDVPALAVASTHLLVWFGDVILHQQDEPEPLGVKFVLAMSPIAPLVTVESHAPIPVNVVPSPIVTDQSRPSATL